MKPFINMLIKAFMIFCLMGSLFASPLIAQEEYPTKIITMIYPYVSGGATDASMTPMVREGIPSLAILAPSRYLHTPTEISDMNDVKDIIKLVTELIKTAHECF